MSQALQLHHTYAVVIVEEDELGYLKTGDISVNKESLTPRDGLQVVSQRSVTVYMHERVGMVADTSSDIIAGSQKDTPVDLNSRRLYV